MGAHDTKSFKSGNSVAVRFPRGTGLDSDVPLTITREGNRYIVERRVDPEEGKRRPRAMLAAIAALPPGGELGERQAIEFPEREGWC